MLAVKRWIEVKFPLEDFKRKFKIISVLMPLGLYNVRPNVRGRERPSLSSMSALSQALGKTPESKVKESAHFVTIVTLQNR